MKSTPLIIRIVVLSALCVFVGYYSWSNAVPPPLHFLIKQGPDLASAFASRIAWLFAVALFVERAVEVVVMVLRDKQADLSDDAEARATQTLDEATKINAAFTGNAAAAQVVDVARKELDAAHNDKTVYRAETKEIALLVGFAIGILVSLSGVRALDGLFSDATAPRRLFTIADVTITGAMLAGGSEGIHRMANVFTSFMDSLSTRADQSQKKT